MFSIANFLDRAKVRASISSDYQLSKAIGISHQSLTQYRTGETIPKDKVIVQLCALSGDDPGLVAAEIHAARASSPEAKSMWQNIARRLAGGASTAILSVLFVAVFLTTFATESRAYGRNFNGHSPVNCLYIVSSRILSTAAFAMVRLRRFWRQMSVFGLLF